MTRVEVCQHEAKERHSKSEQWYINIPDLGEERQMKGSTWFVAFARFHAVSAPNMANFRVPMT